MLDLHSTWNRNPRPARPKFPEARQVLDLLNESSTQSIYFGSGEYRVVGLRRHDGLKWVDNWDLFQVSSHRRVTL